MMKLSRMWMIQIDELEQLEDVEWEALLAAAAIVRETISKARVNS